MQLYLVAKEQWTVYALDEVLDFLDSLEDHLVAQLLPLLERVAEDQRGPKSLNKKICHRVDNAEDIWQIRKGRIRVLWFYDEGRVVICAHAFLKKDNKTPKREKLRACSVKAAYFKAKRCSGLHVIDDVDDE